MFRLGMVLKSISCALILIGALVACSPEPSPIMVPTSTLIPSTATYTPTPPIASSTPRATATVLLIASPSPIQPLLETSITPDASLTDSIIEDLETELAIPGNRIQLVTIEESVFAANAMGCITTGGETIIALTPQEQITGYRYVLLVGDRLYEYHTRGTESFVLCSFTAPVTDELLIMVDPFAADMFRLVQNRLGEELDISSRRVLLVSISPVFWHDTSLGCPLEDQTYSTAEIVGYRIVVTAGEQEYIFHSDSTTVYPCLAENEVLP
jgi:hypothetical protein